MPRTNFSFQVTELSSFPGLKDFNLVDTLIGLEVISGF